MVIYSTKVLVVNHDNQPQLWFFSLILVWYIPVVVVHGGLGFKYPNLVIGLGLGREKKLKRFLSLLALDCSIKWLTPELSPEPWP